MEIQPTRTCPECEELGLEVSEEPNKFECIICGSVWKREIPIIDESGNIYNIPEKLKKLIQE